jgi:signal transduction histidine kinase
MTDDETGKPCFDDAALRPAVLAHELRSPLGAIQGFASLIAEQAYGPVNEPRYVEAAAQALRACAHMENLISGILDAARTQVGGEPLKEEELDLSELVSGAVSWLRREIVEAGVVVRARVELKPIRVRGDRRRLTQALLNVLDNAIRHTPRGGHVDVEIVAGEGVEVAVRNETMAGADDAVSFGGNGLGLYITRCQMRAHGGDAVLRRADEKTFAVALRLPVERRVTKR